MLELRVNPETEIVAWTALTGAEQSHILELTGRRAVAGLSRPRPGCAGTVKALDEATVEFLRRFELGGQACEPRSLSADVRLLILDGVLGVVDAGRILSGPQVARLWPELDRPQTATGAAGRLALDALRYASSLPIDDPRLLSARLYTYNSVPYGARWKAALGRAEAVREWLGVGGRGPNAEALAELGFEEVEHPQWFAWTRRGAEPASLTVKLYVSPRPECLPRVLECTIALLARSGAGSLKLGRTAQNLLRADKFMLYLETLEQARSLAAALAAELRGTPVQGVPFTEACSDDLLVSRGGDPPRALALSGWALAESWRAWIANRLALALQQGRAAGLDEPWRFALLRLEAEGIDSALWSPRAEFCAGA